MYKFYYQIMNEDDEEVLGSFVTINEEGSFEAVEEEIGKAQRRFSNYLLDLEAERQVIEAEEKHSEDGMDNLQDQ